MTCGTPMPEEEMQIIRAMVTRAIGQEKMDMIAESQRRVDEMWSHMTDEEIANWIVSEE